jgi:glycosyltransferase involved in cell wall biosynthesis
MIAPTEQCRRLLTEWQARLAFGWDLAVIPWPIDVERFSYRQRTRCCRFLFVNGHGGHKGRKGADIVAEAARLAPEARVLVVSQTNDLPAFPNNVEVRSAVGDNVDLYAQGDVCIQPSKWEGIGLQLLECQAAGLPLITTDAPPMNEYHALDRIAVARREPVTLRRPLEVDIPCARSLANLMRKWNGADVSVHSLAARRWVVRHHSWRTKQPMILEALTRLANV